MNSVAHPRTVSCNATQDARTDAIATIPTTKILQSCSNYTVNGVYQWGAADYRGPLATTNTGKKCQQWTSQSPHSHNYTPDRYADSGLGDHNQCRDPSAAGFLWCYTADSDARWEECAIDCAEEPATQLPNPCQPFSFHVAALWLPPARSLLC
jgi:hypothetical protein